jgi:hypothetical protein
MRNVMLTYFIALSLFLQFSCLMPGRKSRENREHRMERGDDRHRDNRN